jgi:hypothetical protein
VIEDHSEDVKADIKRNTRMSPVHKESLKEKPEKLQEILCFLPVIVFIFKRGYRTAGEEFDETKRGFCWEHAPSQKPLSVFTQQSHFKRFEEIFEG